MNEVHRRGVSVKERWVHNVIASNKEQYTPCMVNRKVIMHGAWEMNHRAQRTEEKSSCSTHGRAIIVLLARKRKHDRRRLFG